MPRVPALPAFAHADVSGLKFHIQHEKAIYSGRLAVGPRRFSYIRMTLPRAPRADASVRVELASDGTSRYAD